jgi:hypothetical protein
MNTIRKAHGDGIKKATRQESIANRCHCLNQSTSKGGSDWEGQKEAEQCRAPKPVLLPFF